MNEWCHMKISDYTLWLHGWMNKLDAGSSSAPGNIIDCANTCSSCVSSLKYTILLRPVKCVVVDGQPTSEEYCGGKGKSVCC